MAKKTRILFALLLVLVMVFTAACSGKDTDSDQDNDKGSTSLSDKFGKDENDKDEPGKDETKPVESDEDDDEQPQEQLNIDGTVLYEQDGIKVTVTGIEDSYFGPEIMLLVENDTDKNVLVSTEALSVNGYMMTDVMLYADVPAGKKANDSLMFSSSNLEQCGIKELSKLEFYIEVSDPENYNTITMSELLTLNLTAQCNQKIDYSGVELYNEGGIRIIYKGVEDSDLVDGTVNFFVENNTGRTVSVYAKDISINGFASDDSFWTDLRDGTVSLDSMYLWDLSKVNLESVDEIESIELKFRIIDFESWDEIAVTDAITIEN